MRPVDSESTIAAVATAAGEAGIGVIRLSGRDALAVADRIFRSRSGVPPSAQESFRVQVGHVVDSAGGERIDEALLLVMRAPKSYTREDTVEISCHGGRFVVEKTLALCLRNGARAAEPGEFTKRAFLSGRVDLAQAEAVLDLIRAKTDAAHRISRAQLEGRLSHFVTKAREALALVLSRMEAAVDFPDDRIEAPGPSEILAELTALREDLSRVLESSRSGFLAKEGMKAVLVGPPNVGKSSLMNALAGRDRVIVSPRPGTTRDVVELELRCGGALVRLADTAGLRETAPDEIEAAGVRRARDEIDRSDLVLFVVDASAPPSGAERRLWDEIGPRPRFLVVNKEDLRPPDRVARAGPPGNDARFLDLNPGGTVLHTSCVTLAGVDELARRIGRFAAGDHAAPPGEAWISSVRHQDLVEKAAAHLDDAVRACQNGLSAEFPASDVRLAIDALGGIVGEVVTEDILDLIFSRFCIGK